MEYQSQVNDPEQCRLLHCRLLRVLIYFVGKDHDLARLFIKVGHHGGPRTCVLLTWPSIELPYLGM